MIEFIKQIIETITYIFNLIVSYISGFNNGIGLILPIIVCLCLGKNLIIKFYEWITNQGWINIL